MVLVSKQNNRDGKNAAKAGGAVNSYRFCCDYRYLNSQIQDFNYRIPDLQELTESFAEQKPCYITKLDMSNSFFQCGLDPDSSRYTAINTCFGTYKFTRLPMGLKTSSGTFQYVMDKVLHG